MSRTQRDWVIALELRIMNDRWALNNDLREDTDSIENLPESLGFFTATLCSWIAAEISLLLYTNKILESVCY